MWPRQQGSPRVIWSSSPSASTGSQKGGWCHAGLRRIRDIGPTVLALSWPGMCSGRSSSLTAVGPGWSGSLGAVTWRTCLPSAVALPVPGWAPAPPWPQPPTECGCA